MLNELIASATRCVSRDSTTSPAGPPSRSVPFAVFPSAAAIRERLVARRQAGRRQPIEDLLLRLLERGIAGEPPQRRHERHDVHRHLGVDARRKLPIDRLRPRRQRAIERRQMRR